MKINAPSIALSGAVELLKAYEQDPEAIAREADMPIESLYSQNMTVEGSEIARFFELSARACKTRYFGIELAQYQSLQILGPIWMLMRNARSVGDAIEKMVDNFLLHTDVTAFSLEREQEGLTLCYEIIGEDISDEVQIIEHGLGMMCMELRLRLGRAWSPEYAQLRYAAPYDTSELEKALGHNIYYNQDRHAIHINAKDLARPYIASNLDQSSIIQGQLKSKLENVEQKQVVQTEIAIRTLLAHGVCKIESVATELGTTPRTLQRRLLQHGYQFQELVDKVRLDLAKQYLRTSSLSVGSIAERLQYSETAAFSRFFKRKTGISPREFSRLQTALKRN